MCSSSFCKYVDKATEVPADDNQSQEEFMQQNEDQEQTTQLGHHLKCYVDTHLNV